MKKSLLATVATVALIAGPGLAMAQQKQEAPAAKSEAPARAPSAMQNAPAEKVAPAGRAETRTPESKPSTTGQATPSGKPADAQMKAGSDTKAGTDTKSGVNVDTKSSADTKSGADTRASGTTDTKASSSTTAAQGQAGASGSVALTTEQKTKIRSTVLTANAPRVTNVNFTLNVGTVVPRSVRLVAVPAPLIEIHPAWRGYMYFVHGDQIVIVEPGTLKIVTIITV